MPSGAGQSATSSSSGPRREASNPRAVRAVSSGAPHSETVGRNVSRSKAAVFGKSSLRDAASGVPAIPSTAADAFTSISESLHEAASALRRLVPVPRVRGAGAEAHHAAKAITVASQELMRHALADSGPWTPDRLARMGSTALSDVPGASEVGSPSLPSMLLGGGQGGLASSLLDLGGAPSPEARLHGVVDSAGTTHFALDVDDNVGGNARGDLRLAPAIQRLVCENTALREALEDANTRLSQLEDEKLRFFDEGVFDVMNSMCDHTSYLADASPHATALSLPQPPCSPPTGSESEPARSEVLSGENAKLRMELVHAREVGDALAEQQKTAEIRMLSLEQEQVWLNERLVRLSEGVDESHIVDDTDAGTGSSRFTGTVGSVHVAPHVQRDAADENRALWSELEEAARLRDQLLQQQPSIADASPKHSNVTAALSLALDPARDPLKAGSEQHTADQLAAAQSVAIVELAQHRRGSEELTAACQAELAAQVAQQRELQLWEQTQLQAERRELDMVHERQVREAESQLREALARESQLREAQLRETQEAYESERQGKDQIITDLDDQTHALAQKLEETEARSRALAEENRRLQAALPKPVAAPAGGPDGGTALDGDPPSGKADTNADVNTRPDAEDCLDQIELEEAW